MEEIEMNIHPEWTKQLDKPEHQKALRKAVAKSISDLADSGYKITDSDMFKYTPAYTGDFWKK